mmetsp:Transcript_20746/g.44256  ORF Transcript_20746/g.44256 Transcript_20746/m.44256 type:complete len:128 (-) Transcript_20746:31-414(-)
MPTTYELSIQNALPRTIHEVPSALGPRGIMQTNDVPQGGLRSRGTRQCTLKVFQTEERLDLALPCFTRIVELKEILAEQTGSQNASMQFVIRQGPYIRLLKDTDEVHRSMIVKGVENLRSSKITWAN